MKIEMEQAGMLIQLLEGLGVNIGIISLNYLLFVKIFPPIKALKNKKNRIIGIAISWLNASFGLLLSFYAFGIRDTFEGKVLVFGIITWCISFVLFWVFPIFEARKDIVNKS